MLVLSSRPANRAVIYVLVVVLTVVIDWGLLNLRAALTASCPHGRQTFSTYVRCDPYCIVDPACMSPLYKPTWTDPRFAPHWQGLAWLGESAAHGSGLRMLAIPNYLFFMLLLCATAVGIVWRVSWPRLRRLFLTALTTWLILEVLRWLAIISNYDLTVPFFSWYLVFILTLSMFILWGAIVGSSHIVRLRRRVKADGRQPG
jgi:hypothetical protein